METYTHSHFPAQFSVVHVALYTAVTNAPLLRARIIKAATTQGVQGDHERSAVNFAFVDARLVSPVPLYFKFGYSDALK
jgi:EKC/KEOPS complex subunit CGI121/TPRKB